MAVEPPKIALRGLYTSPNPYSAAPDGALETADNVVLRDPALLEPRRGYTETAAIPSGQAITRVFPAKGGVYAFDAMNALYSYSGGAWSAAYTGGPFPPPDTTNPVRAALANKSFLFTTNAGVKISDTLTNSRIGYAGVGMPPFLQATQTPDAGGYLAVGASAAYSAVFCYYDENKILVQSAPSNRLVVTRPASVTVPIGGVSDFGVTPNLNTVEPHNLVVGDTVSLTTTDTNPPRLSSGTFTVVSVSDQFNFTLFSPDFVSATNTVPLVFVPTSPANVAVTAQLPPVTGGSIVFAQLYRTHSNATSLSPGPPVDPGAEFFQVAEHIVTPAEVVSGTVTFSVDATPDNGAGGGLLSVALYTNALTGNSSGEANDFPPLARDLALYNTRLLYANTTEPQAVDLQLVGTAGLGNGSTLIVGGVTYSCNIAPEAVAAKRFKLYVEGTPSENISRTAQSLCRVVSGYNYITGGPLVAYYMGDLAGTPGAVSIREAGVGGAPFAIHAGQDGQVCWSPDLSKASYVQTSIANRRPNRIWWSRDNIPWGVPSLTNWAEVGDPDRAILRIIPVRSTVFIFKEDGLFTLQGNTPENYSFAPYDTDLILVAPESCAVLDNAIYCWTNRGAVLVSESGVSPAVSKPIERDLRYVERTYPTFSTAAFGVADTSDATYIAACPIAPGDNGCSQQYVFAADTVAWTRWLISNAAHGCFDPGARALVFAVRNRLWQERRTFTSLDYQNPDGSAIACTARLLPIAAGNPLFEKMFRTVVLSFRLAEFDSCTVGFDSDAAGSITTVAPKSGPGAVGFGGFAWGGLPFGKSSRQFLLRMDVPQGVGLAANLGMTLNIAQAARFWQLQGVSVVFEPSSTIPRR